MSREAPSIRSMGLSFLRPILLAAGVASLVATLVLFSVSISRPFVGVSIRPEENGVWVVDETDYTGLAQDAGIAPGDVVLAVNGQSVEEFTEAHGRLPPGGIRELRVVDNAGTEKAVSVAEGAPSAEGLYAPAGFLILGLAFWITGFMAYVKRVRRKGVLPLYLLGLTVPLGLMAAIATSRWSAGTLTLQFIAYVLISGLLMHFFLQFPHENSLVARYPALLYLCYAPGVVPLCLFFVFCQNWDLFESCARAPVFAYFSFGAVVAAASLTHSYVRPHSRQERQQIKILLASILSLIHI